MKDKISLIYKIIIVIVSGIALYLNFKFLSFRQGILYFTNISNLLCFIYFLGLVTKMLMKKEETFSEFHCITKGTITMAITLTFFMYNFALRGDSVTSVFIGHELECYLVHIVVPLLVMFDYAIFGVKGHLKKSYPFIWSTILIAYQVFIIIYVAVGGRFINDLKYPYSYMDVATLGIPSVIINMLIVYIMFILYGIMIQRIDSLIGSKRQEKKKIEE